MTCFDHMSVEGRNAMNKICYCTILILAMTCTATGEEFNKGGRTSLQFLKIGVGGRQVAMGEACIANVRDINSVFWNPAGISGLQGLEASFSYSSWFADLKYFAGAVGYRWGDVGTFALSYAGLDYGQIQEALVTVAGGGSDTRTGQTFGGGDMLLGLSYTRDFTDQLSIGVTMKYLEEKLFIYGVNLFAFDVGTFYNTGFNGIRLAMAAQNYGGSVKWLGRSDLEEGYDIPLVFRIGASVGILGSHDAFIDFGSTHNLTVTIDAVHTNDYAERLHLGGEYLFSDILAVRAGYKFNYEEGNLSLGFGLRQKLEAFEVRVDYAYVKFSHLESPHRLTLTVAY